MIRGFVILMALGAGVLEAQPVKLEFRSGNGSRLTLEVYKTGLLRGKKHIFEFERFQGLLTFDPKSPVQSKVELSIESASYVLKDDWVSDKDRRNILELTEKEMLQPSRFPQIRFASRQVTAKPDGSYDVEGGLTLRGLDKPAIVNVTFKPAGAGWVFSGRSEIRMKDYGLKPPSAALGAVGTKNEMAVSFSVTASPK